jgi:hypothetical protein
LYVKKPQDGCRTDNFGNRPGKSHKDYDYCLDNVENDLRVMNIKRWRKKRLKIEKNGHPSLRRPRFLKDCTAKEQASNINYKEF